MSIKKIKNPFKLKSVSAPESTATAHCREILDLIANVSESLQNRWCHIRPMDNVSELMCCEPYFRLRDQEYFTPMGISYCECHGVSQFEDHDIYLLMAQNALYECEHIKIHGKDLMRTCSLFDKEKREIDGDVVDNLYKGTQYPIDMLEHTQSLGVQLMLLSMLRRKVIWNVHMMDHCRCEIDPNHVNRHNDHYNNHECKQEDWETKL